MAERLSPRLLLHPLDFLSLGFGSGLVPAAPGTAGTLVAIPVYLLMQSFALALATYLAVVAVLFIAGIGLCSHTAGRLGVHDHPAIVWDEIVGYLVTMSLAPAGWLWVAAGFALFRLFDVLKPWPIRWLDTHIHGGFGIMLDDLVAGLCAAAALQVFTLLL